MANQDYRAGEYLNCTVEAEEAGGYTVTVNGDDRVGFLPTSVSCRLGEVIKAQFICMKGDRILVSAKFNDSAKREPSAEPKACPNLQSALDVLNKTLSSTGTNPQQ